MFYHIIDILYHLSEHIDADAKAYNPANATRKGQAISDSRVFNAGINLIRKIS